MEKTTINETLRRNVAELSKQTDREVSMMPATVAPLPSVEMVKRIVALVKNIIFPDYFEKRQPDEAIRAYHIGVAMEELAKLLTKQIAHGLQFCEHCEGERTKEQVYTEAERLALEFIDALPEIKRLLYTDIQAMFDNDPAAPNYGEVIFCYPSMNTMTHYRVAHKLHQLQVPVIPRIITELMDQDRKDFCMFSNLSWSHTVLCVFLFCFVLFLFFLPLDVFKWKSTDILLDHQKVKVAQSLFETLRTIQSMEFSRLEYWSG